MQLPKKFSNLDWHKLGITILGVGIGLAIIGALAAAYFMNAAATGPSAAESRINGWVGQLSDPELTPARHLAQQQLEQAGDASIDPLITALHAPDSTLRRNSAEMLGFIASPRSLNALEDSMATDPVPSVRSRAAWALGELHDLRAVSDLNQASVVDQNVKVRQEASGSLEALRARLAAAAGRNDRTTSAFATAPADGSVVYLADMNHVSISRDGGKTWNPVAGSPPSRITTMAVSPSNPDIVYAGTESMGLYETTDGGTTWVARNRGLGLDPGVRLTVTAIVIDASNPARLYVATGEWIGTSEATLTPLNTMLTVDGGETWQRISVLSGTSPVSRLAISGNALYELRGDQVSSLQL